MIKIHCSQLKEFLQIYVLDWHVLPTLLVPVIFTLFFPIYWFILCPLIWKEFPNTYRPRTLLIGYWLFASLVWLVFLAVCLYHMRNGHENALRGASTTSCGVREDMGSTEDIWNEDKYIPDAAYLPSPPDIRVNVSAIQPRRSQLEPKHEMDETWDYDYESAKTNKLVSDTRKTRACKSSFDNNSTLTATPSLNGRCGRLSPAFPRQPNSIGDVNGNSSPRFRSMNGNYVQGQRPPLHLMRPAPLRIHPSQRTGLKNYHPTIIHPNQLPSQRLKGNVGLSTTSLPSKMLRAAGNDYFDISTDEENESNRNGRVSKNTKGSRRSLPITPPHHIQGGPNKFRFRNAPCNGTRRLSGTLPPQPNGSLRSHGHVMRHMSGQRMNMQRSRRGSTTKRNSKDGLRHISSNTAYQEGSNASSRNSNSVDRQIERSNSDMPPTENCESVDSSKIKAFEVGTTRPKQPLKCLEISPNIDLKSPRKLSVSLSDGSLSKVGRPLSAGNLNWFKPVITGSLEFSKTSLLLPSHLKEEKKHSDYPKRCINNNNELDNTPTLSKEHVKVFTEEELRSATDVYTGRIERKDSLVSDGKFDSILNSLNLLAVKIEKDFKEENNMTAFAKERIKSKDTQKLIAN